MFPHLALWNFYFHTLVLVLFIACSYFSFVHHSIFCALIKTYKNNLKENINFYKIIFRGISKVMEGVSRTIKVISGCKALFLVVHGTLFIYVLINIMSSQGLNIVDLEVRGLPCSGHLVTFKCFKLVCPWASQVLDSVRAFPVGGKPSFLRDSRSFDLS